MADGGRDDILGQKAQAAQRAFEARGMSLAKALRRALSRTADVLWDLALVTQSVAVEMLDQDGVVAALTPGDLLLLLDGPDGALGLVLVDRQVMTGLIEVQTIQQVTQMPLVAERDLTATDAAMMAPLLDGALDRLADSLADHPLHGQLQGYRFGAMVEDARTAALLLDGAAYRVFTVDIDLALGRRRGLLKLILPERKPRRGADAPPPDDLPGPHEALLSRVPAKLNAVLTRVRLPLNKARDLKPGDLLPLAPDALDRVEVMAGTGHLVARGRLGKVNGLRAVRLTWPVIGEGAGPGAAFAGTAAGIGVAEAITPDSGGPDALPDLPATNPEPEFDIGDFSGAEALPELPAMDFAAEAAEFDIDALGEDAASFEGGEPLTPLPDVDMSDDFAAESVHFDGDG
ncbi:FliM/FliN family flagellar motor C-terminal domain-containing protein [Ponticoccus alexandrii]|uniref:Flagellar motor switch protein FliM n=1 Tax=Ponticoccus alexandrii TaxID=1943633 RepID=A0ABX7FA75_9RHOB|nr:FliM/FliN family flagellar motor C-terminal domain-containing protein [Ponticoccus alexandrii]QRF67288.1 flagellar motor switch protein FliM [Ponticoccus alexandrii]